MRGTAWEKRKVFLTPARARKDPLSREVGGDWLGKYLSDDKNVIKEKRAAMRDEVSGRSPDNNRGQKIAHEGGSKRKVGGGTGGESSLVRPGKGEKGGDLQGRSQKQGFSQYQNHR